MPRWIVALLFMVALTFILFGGANAAREFDPGIKAERLEQARHLSAINAVREREAWEAAERNARFWSAVVSVGSVAVGLFIAALTLAAMRVAWAGAQIAAAKAVEAQVHARLVYADAMGALPVDAPGLFGGRHDNLIAMTHAGALTVRNTAAANPVPRLPDGLRTYNHAPRLGSKPAVAALPNAAAPALPTPSPLAVPPFYQLLDSGVISPGSELALGFEPDGQLVSTPMDGLFSVGVAGLPGSGKTNTATWIAGQAVLHGARILIADLHANATGKAGEQSLARNLAPLHSAFLEPPADNPDAVAGLARSLRSEVERRKGGAQGDAILFAVDEFTALMRSSAADELAALLETIGQEGRKFGIFPLLCAQVWTVDRVGGNAVRDVLASSFIHRSKPGQARLLAPGLGNEVFSLPVGQAFLSLTTGETARVSIPRVTRNDLFRVVDMLPMSSGRSDNRSWGSSGTVLEPVLMPEPPILNPASQNGSTELRFPIDPPRPLTPVEAEEVRRRRALPTSKTDLCETVYKFKNGETWDYIMAALEGAV